MNKILAFHRRQLFDLTNTVICFKQISDYSTRQKIKTEFVRITWQQLS